MPSRPVLATTLFPLALLASCSSSASVDSENETISASTEWALEVEEFGSFEEPWGAAFAPGTEMLFVTEKPGTIRFVDTRTRRSGVVAGAPQVDYGGQGGLGDIAFLRSEASATLGARTIYLSWVEAGDKDTRGAVVGRGKLACEGAASCAIADLEVIWRQSPKVTGRGHYSHRIAFSPDGQYLFLSSGDRQKMQPAQDTSNNLGSIVRLELDGTPAAGNPLAKKGGVSAELWSWGHRNVLGLAFDASGQLWDLEHGPAGGDEINRVRKGTNYGWPVVSEGKHYGGEAIPSHATKPEFAAPAISWTPVIAPGDFFVYSGELFADWQGKAVIAAMKPGGLVVVDLAGDRASEAGRIDLGSRIREVVEGPDGALWAFEDGDGARLLKLTPG